MICSICGKEAKLLEGANVYIIHLGIVMAYVKVCVRPFYREIRGFCVAIPGPLIIPMREVLPLFGLKATDDAQ